MENDKEPNTYLAKALKNYAYKHYGYVLPDGQVGIKYDGFRFSLLATAIRLMNDWELVEHTGIDIERIQALKEMELDDLREELEKEGFDFWGQLLFDEDSEE